MGGVRSGKKRVGEVMIGRGEKWEGVRSKRCERWEENRSRRERGWLMMCYLFSLWSLFSWRPLWARATSWSLLPRPSNSAWGTHVSIYPRRTWATLEEEKRRREVEGEGERRGRGEKRRGGKKEKGREKEEEREGRGGRGEWRAVTYRLYTVYMCRHNVIHRS